MHAGKSWCVVLVCASQAEALSMFVIITDIVKIRMMKKRLINAH